MHITYYVLEGSSNTKSALFSSVHLQKYLTVSSVELQNYFDVEGCFRK